MAKIFIDESTLTAIGDAIRSKTGKNELIDPANMSAEIANIEGGEHIDEYDGAVSIETASEVETFTLARTLSGKWKLNEQLTLHPETLTEQLINFTTTPSITDANFLGFRFNQASGGMVFVVIDYPTTPQLPIWVGVAGWQIEGNVPLEVDFGAEPQEVSEEFYDWFTANATSQDAVEITYNGSVIATLSNGQTATLLCGGKKMEGDVEVKLDIIPVVDTEAVYNEGFADGKAEGVEEGKQTEHDAFWDTILQNGERTDCNNLFYGPAWTDETFTPNRDIKPTRANYMFKESKIRKSEYLNKVDFSNCQAIIQTFYNLQVEELGTLDFGSVIKGWNGINQTFYSCTKLRKIGLLIPPRDKGAPINAFSGLPALEEITFGGTIYMSISFDKSPLIKASIISVMSYLADDVSGMTATFNKDAVDKAFETSEGANDGSTSAEWLELIGTKPNWTISLV